jgi:hypothetical protein
MLDCRLVAVIALALPLSMPAFAQVVDMSKYPNWEGQWGRGMSPGSWDPTKPKGLGQAPPLTPEYQAAWEANLAKIKEGKEVDPKGNCLPPGMPRLMMIYQPMEIVIKPNVTYFLLEAMSPVRRIYTDGRGWPKTFPPGFDGYSIGQWLDQDGDGKYDALTIETRGISGKRLFDGNAIPLAEDGSTVVKEHISIDKSNPDTMLNEITTTDRALAKPWTVTRKYRRSKKNAEYSEYNCEESRYVTIGAETYMLGLDGFLMPLAKNQRPPDLRYFK